VRNDDALDEIEYGGYPICRPSAASCTLNDLFHNSFCRHPYLAIQDYAYPRLYPALLLKDKQRRTHSCVSIARNLTDSYYHFVRCGFEE